MGSREFGCLSNGSSCFAEMIHAQAALQLSATFVQGDMSDAFADYSANAGFAMPVMATSLAL
eukprot:3811259-Amphidinium_carterae.1